MEYRPDNPPEEESKECPHCCTEFYGEGFKGYCSKACCRYDVE